MKRITIIGLCLAMLWSIIFMVGCKSVSKNPELIYGKWNLVGKNGEMTPICINFLEDGSYYYSYDGDVTIDTGSLNDAVDSFMESKFMKTIKEFADQSGLTALFAADSLQRIISELSGILKFEYTIKSNTSMRVNISMLFGLLNHSYDVAFEWKGDTLTFDGLTYIKADKK